MNWKNLLFSESFLLKSDKAIYIKFVEKIFNVNENKLVKNFSKKNFFPVVLFQ